MKKMRPGVDSANILRALRSLDLEDVTYLGSLIDIPQAELGQGNILELSLQLKSRAEIYGKLGALQAHLSRHYSYAWNKANKSRIIAGNPYRGLEPFKQEDAALFFGREAETRSLFRRIWRGGRGEASPLTLIISASGAGKSSLVGAGLFPLLNEDNRTREWVTAKMTPARYADDPLDGLSSALVRSFGWGGPDFSHNKARLLQNIQSADTLRETIIGNLPDGQILLLWIDQFEEIFTRTPEGPRRQFLQIIFEALGPPFLIVATLRAEFYHRCLQERDTLLPYLERSHFPLGLPDESALAAIIECPPACAGFTVQPELVGRLIGDVGTEPGNLALLAFSLEDIFERFIAGRTADRVDGRLSLEDYVGLREVLSQRGEEVLARFSDSEVEAFESSLPELVEASAGEPLSRRRADAASIYSRHPEARAVIEALIEARILVTDQEVQSHSPTVEVAHEAILMHWPRLRQLVQKQEEDLQLRHTLEGQTLAWAGSGRSRDLLTLKGAQLELALEWTTRFPHWSRDLPRTPEDRQIKIERPVLDVIRELPMTPSAVGACEVSPDESLLLVQTADMTLSLWSLQDKKKIAELSGGPCDCYYCKERPVMHFSPDSRWIILKQDFGTLVLFRADTGRLHRRLGSGFEARDVAFSPDAAHVVTVGRLRNRAETNEGEKKPFAVWDVQRGERVVCYSDFSDDFYSVVYSPDGGQFATGGAGGIQLWDGRSFKPLKQLSRSGQSSLMAFAPRDRTLVTASGNLLRMWAADTGEEIPLPEQPQGVINDICWSNDGTRLLVLRDEQRAETWDAKNLRKLSSWRLTKGQLRRLWFSNGDHYVQALSEEGRLSVASATDGRLVALAAGKSQDLRAVPSRPGDGPPSLLRSRSGEQLRFWRLAERPATTDEDGVRYGSIADYVRSCARSEDRLEKTLENRLAQSQRAESLLLAAASRRLTATGRAMDGLCLALEGLPRRFEPPDRPLVAQAEQALYEAWHQTHEVAHLPVTGWAYESSFDFHGDLVAYTTGEQDVRVYDLSSRQLTGVFEGHRGKVLFVRFHPNGRWLLSAGKDHVNRLWDPSSCTEHAVLEGHSKKILNTLFSPLGDFVLSSALDQTVRLWRSRDGEPLLTITSQAERPRPLAFSPDSKIFAALLDDGTVGLWVASWRQQCRKLEGESKVYALAFSPNGRELATIASDHKLRVWNLRTASIRLTIELEELYFQILYSADGQRLIAGPASIWNAKDGEPLDPYAQPEMHQDDLAEHPSGKILAIPCGKVVSLIDVESRTLRRQFAGHTDKVRSLGFDRFGRRLGSRSDHELKIWNVERGLTARDCDEESHVTLWSLDGRLLLTTPGYGDHLRVWDVDSGEILRTIDVPEPVRLSVHDVHWSADGQRIALATDGEILVWTGGNVETCPHPRSKVFSVRLSRDGRYLVALTEPQGDDAPELPDLPPQIGHIWDIDEGKKIGTLEYSHQIMWLDFSPDGRWIVAVDSSEKTMDGRLGENSKETLKIIELSTGNRVAEASFSTMSSVAFSDDGRLMAVSHSNGGFLYDLELGKQIDTIAGHSQVRFGPGGRLLVVCEPSQVSVLDLDSGETILTEESVTNEIFSFADLDSRSHIMMIYADYDLGMPSYHRAVKVINRHSGELLFTVGGVESSVAEASLRPQGDWVLTVSEEKRRVSLWPVRSSTERLVADALRVRTRELSAEERRELIEIAEVESFDS